MFVALEEEISYVFGDECAVGTAGTVGTVVSFDSMEVFAEGMYPVRSCVNMLVCLRFRPSVAVMNGSSGSVSLMRSYRSECFHQAFVS